MGRVRTITTETDDSARQDDLEAYPEHPLFPLMEDEKSFDVSFVQVTRFEHGVQKWGPAVPAEELKSENDILERWGGGQYVLVARGIAKQEGVPGRIKKHRRISLPGLSKPLSSDPTPEEKNLANPEAAGVATSRAAAPQQSGGDMVSLVSLMMQMNQQAADRASQQNQQFMQMFLAMMNNGKSDAQAMTQMMLQMTSQSQQAMMGLISTVMANRGGGPEEMAKYADLLRSLGVGGGAVAKESEAGGAESVGSMLENAADVIQGLVALKGGPAQAGAPQGAFDPNQPPQPTPGFLGGAGGVLRGVSGGG